MKMSHASAVALWFLFSTFASAQAVARRFEDIPIGIYPGNQRLERGVGPGMARGTSDTDVQFSEDIARLCAQGDPPFRLNVLAAEGGFDSLRRLLTDDEVNLAIVQGDVWTYASLIDSGPIADGKTEGKRDQQIRDSWREISEDIRLVLPLYQKRIHIFVSAEANRRGKFKNLWDLFEKGATVNVGPQYSESYITCAILEKMIIDAKEGAGQAWKRDTSPTDEALRIIVGKGERSPESLDAVILCAESPERAEEELRRLVQFTRTF